MLNAVTGWTLLGWLASLVWSVNKDVRGLVEDLSPVAAPSQLEPSWNPELPAQPLSSGEFKHCPFCAEAIRVEAVVCRYCSRELTDGEPARPATDLALHEKRHLQTLLVDSPEQPADRSLLDIFEYARLLEAEENSAVLTLVAGAPASSPSASAPADAQEKPAGLDWDDIAPDVPRVAAR